MAQQLFAIPHTWCHMSLQTVQCLNQCLQSEK